MDFYRTKQYIINRLHVDLDRRLIYHDLEHTLDVYHAAQRISEAENIDKHSMQLILTAALFHDSGMLLNYENHEEESILICKEELPKFNYTDQEIDTISRLIKKTKLAETANCSLENILCDADLDYLGREDFIIKSTKLLLEWKYLGKHSYSLVEWLRIQIHFLETHQYNTKSAQTMRNETKIKNIEEIRALYKICSEPTL
jgi:HD superfamily phosphodiesterase